jgi:hypothetical protein
VLVKPVEIMTNHNTPPRPSVLGLSPSFGFGDRIGLATPGHIAAIRRAGGSIRPIFAQQSIREMTRTGRSPEQVMDDAMGALRGAEWQQPHGADADHLKSEADVDRTAAAGFTFFTIDPSEHVEQRADDYDAPAINERFAAIRERIDWFDQYVGRNVNLEMGRTLAFDEATLKRAAVKYGLAIQFAIRLGTHIDKVQRAAGREYEIELSIDETPQPTTLAEHWIIAEQCLQAGMKLVSVAPRFIGDFEKGVDYIGDVAAYESSLADHAAIARQLGPYKLSLHSGSDKLSIYPALARATRGLFHVKTAGTSYLEALRTVALCRPELFRQICEFARSRYEVDRATYHVHATLDSVPAVSELKDDSRLRRVYLEDWRDVPTGRGFTAQGRQILHCTFGSVLTDNYLGAALRKCLEEHIDEYTHLLSEHFGRHLNALQVERA